MRTRTIAGTLALLALLAVVTPAALRATPQETQVRKPVAGEAAEAHLGKGYEALKNDRYEVAVSEFRAALESDPKLLLRARFPLAVALLELHKSAEARQEFETVRHEVGDHPNVLYYLGRLDLDDRKFASAIKNFRQAATNPPFPDTAYYLGYAYAKQGAWVLAEKWLKKAAEATPRDSRVQYQLGMVYRNQGHQEAAKKAFALSEELRRRDGNESRIRLECGQKLEQGPREEAHAICDQLYDPDNADKLTELGALYGQHGDLEAALKSLRRAAELAPQSPQVQYNLAFAYFQLNRFEEARAPLAATIKRWPDLFQLNALYGAVLFKLGEDATAYQTLHRALQLNPEDAATVEFLYATTLRLAATNQDAQRYSDSLRYLEEASRLRPNDPGPHRLMADIYTETGRPAQAAAEQQAADRLSHP
jgi:tetratricopeptide (TPR) repeat protein